MNPLETFQNILKLRASAINGEGIRKYKTELVKLYDVSQSKPATLHCLNFSQEKTMGLPVSPNIFCNVNRHRSEFWNAFQYTIPNYMNSVYYDVSHLIDLKLEPDDDLQLALPCSMFAWYDYLGMKYVKTLSYLFLEEIDDNIAKHVSNLEEKMKLAWNGVMISPPEGEHLSSDAGEFLLDPCIHMQLPWKPMLLQQWLAAALAEVLLFERATVELRHWPIREEVANVAESVVTMVRQLKERILLGFAIVNQQITSYPEVMDPKLPSYILDEVVLPAVPILEFLIKKEAEEIVETLTLQFRIGSSSRLVNLPTKCYQLDPALANLHHKFAFNFPMWHGDKLTTPFPVVSEDLADIVQRLKSPEDYSLKPEPDIFNLEEKYLLKIIDDNIKSSKTTYLNDRIESAIQFITEIISKNKETFAGITKKEVLNKFSDCKIKAEEFLDFKISELHYLVLYYTFILLEIMEMCHLYEIPPSDSNNDGDTCFPCSCKVGIPFQIIDFQLKVFNFDVLAKLVNICAIIFQTSNQSTSKDSPSICTKDFKIRLDQLQTRVENQNRDKFWDIFYRLWEKPLSTFESDIADCNPTDPRYITMYLMIRNTRLILNTCKTNFKLIETNCKPIEYSSLTHYIVPHLISTYFKFCNDNPKFSRYDKILYAIINTCEYWYSKTTHQEFSCNQNENPKSDEIFLPRMYEYLIQTQLMEWNSCFKNFSNLEKEEKLFINKIYTIMYCLLETIIVNEKFHTDLCTSKTSIYTQN